jgi:hypothetical protein
MMQGETHSMFEGAAEENQVTPDQRQPDAKERILTTLKA